MVTFNLRLVRTNYPLAPRVGRLATPYRPIFPASALVSPPVLIVENPVASTLPEQPRVWRVPNCPDLTASDIENLPREARGPAPTEWLETGLGIVGQWGTASLASLALAAAGGAVVAPKALIVAGGAALIGTVGSLALSATRREANLRQTIQLNRSNDLQTETVDMECGQTLPPPSPAPLAAGGGEGGAVAIPEWWPTRPGADRPQLVLLFARQKEDGGIDRTVLRTLTIPHYDGPVPHDTPPVGPHRRGPYLVELTLRDNTKLRILAESPEEGIRVINQAKAVVKPNMVDGEGVPSVKKMENPSDRMYRVMTVVPIKGIFYPRGQRIEDEDGRPVVMLYRAPQS